MADPGTRERADAGVAAGDVLLDKYRVDAVLGAGGMGVVVRATHLGLGEPVAIKMLRPDGHDAEGRTRFLREAQAAVRLKSEHVARVTDVGTLPTGAPYMVMELLEGVDLEQMVEVSGVLAAPLAVDLLLQACEAIGEAHALGIVHRDIKPSNFFVTWRADGSPLCKVLDFGISKAPVGVELSLTQTQSVLGTPAYMSPEQMRSARGVDARSDIWSLGTVLYEVLCAHRPFEAETFSEMCVKVAVDPPTPLSVEAPAGVQEIIFRCLEKDPARRFQSVAELARALAPFARDARAAAVVVERLERMQSRGEALRAETSGAFTWASLQTMPSGSAPAVAAVVTPPAGVAAAGPAAGPKTIVDPPRQRGVKQRVMTIGLAAMGMIAVAVLTVMIGSRGDETQPTSMPATHTTPDVTPPAIVVPVDAAMAVAPAVIVDAAITGETAVTFDASPSPSPPTTTSTSTPTGAATQKKHHRPSKGSDDDEVFGRRK